MLLGRQASLERSHVTGPQSFRGDSSRTRQAVIGNRLENFMQIFSSRGLNCHQLPFQSEKDLQCVELALVRQPCSNLVKQRHKRSSVVWH